MPLIIKIPYCKKKRIIKAVVQSIDIMPTIFDLVGVEIPHYVQGKSLLPLMQNKKTTIHEYVYGQSSTGGYLRSHNWKLILDQNIMYEDKLYNIKNDPQELRNVCRQHLEVYYMLKTKLKEFIESLPVYKEKEDSFLPSIDPKTQERIKKTGYW